MIDRVALQSLPPAERARMIYGEAQAQMSRRLWQAALGSGESNDTSASVSNSSSPRADRSTLDTLLALLGPEATADTGAIPVTAPVAEPAAKTVETVDAHVEGLGPNTRYASMLEDAATRTGIPATALAAIVDAEAGKNADGSWQAFSRNPRSSAAGLGQFLGGTWEGMAETSGTWLNGVARNNGWLNEAGQVTAGARSSVLALRYDPAASINGIADYARRNIDGLRKAGVASGDDADGTARLAYLGHHLGLGDAVRFLRGGLGESRAKVLLNAQIGTAGSERRIEAAGGASAAHRNWLLSYVDRKVRPDRFAGSLNAG